MFSIQIPRADGTGIVDIEPHDGRNLGAVPLGHKELVEFLTSPERRFPLTMTNVRVSGGGVELGDDPPLCFEGQMTSNSTGQPLMGLLAEGWLPFPLASAEVAFVDRNVVSTLESLSATDLAHPVVGSGQHFAHRHAFELAGAHVSALPYVLEGRHKRLPNLSDIRRSLVRAQAALRRVLPADKVITYTKEDREGIFGMLGDMSRYRSGNCAFLREACPLVAQAVASNSLLVIEGRIIGLALKHGVPIPSLPVLAMLSALYDNKPGLGRHKANRPGRAVLKPTKNYSEEDAYNALADLDHLELLVTAYVIGLAGTPVLYTHDQGLAAMWVAMAPKNIRLADRAPRMDMTVTAELVPSLSEDDRFALAARLSEYAAKPSSRRH